MQKLFKSSSHFGSRKPAPKMGVGAIVFVKINEAKPCPPFWGSGNDSQNGSRMFCVFCKLGLEFDAGNDNLQPQTFDF